MPTLKSVLHEIGKSADIGIIPIENFSEGFVAQVLDELVDLDLSIIAEVLLPIEFSFVSNCESLKEVNDVFVQFVAKGQCVDFITSMGPININVTESNIESLQKSVNSTSKTGAIVPIGAFDESQFKLVINKVNDYAENQTRFLVLEPKGASVVSDQADKTSIIVLDDEDHPGLLGEVLQCFSSRQINLSAILSCPTRKSFGKYHFFIELEGSINEKEVADALREIQLRNKVKVLGSFTRASL